LFVLWKRFFSFLYDDILINRFDSEVLKETQKAWSLVLEELKVIWGIITPCSLMYEFRILSHKTHCMHRSDDAIPLVLLKSSTWNKSESLFQSCSLLWKPKVNNLYVMELYSHLNAILYQLSLAKFLLNAFTYS
jgi:hypothetical protein